LFFASDLNLPKNLCNRLKGKTMNRKIATILLLASATGLAACSKKAPETLPPVAGPTSTSTDNTTPMTQPGGPMVGTQEHFAGAVGSSTTIYFDTDRFNIDSQDAAALQAQAQYFARYPQITFTIEGHADERGTREYNLALGEKRANSAKAYLVSLGVDGNRVSVVSYGKERPVALDSSESAWAQNRRAASVIINR
jgi:peptidoglycan-associated lipoprotein